MQPVGNDSEVTTVWPHKNSIIIIIIMLLVPTVVSIPKVKSKESFKRKSWSAKGSGRRRSQATRK